MAFDLDDEELKATRRMNGSDKNVGSIGNNIEEDIKIALDKFSDNKDIEILENLLEEGFEAMCYPEAQAIEHLIQAYKELEEENKRLTGNYYTLCADIQMVISELGFPEDTIIADEFVSMIKENYIEKSLVEEKIEEIDKIYKGIPEDEGNFAKAILIKEKQVLQELLEKRK